MTNKKTELTRLGLFLIITFSLTWIPHFICLGIWGYEEWMKTPFSAIISLTMFAPMLGNILTRLITKEGLWSDRLCFNLKGNLKHYCSALLFPILFGVIMVVLVNCTYGNWSFVWLADQKPYDVFTSLMSTLTAPVFYFSFVCFGEEYGWRGYMNDKLKSLTGTAGAVIIGGIIWGLWHAPLVAKGYNFGEGHPLLGVLLMCVSCILINAICMYLTEKTGSVYPAVLFHVMLDISPEEELLRYFGGGLSPEIQPKVTAMQYGLVLMVIIPAVFGAVCFYLLMRDKNRAPETA